MNQLDSSKNATKYVPLNNLNDDGKHDVSQSDYIVCNSSLSEAAILAFEWGYSLENVNSLVCWEAQFGDFANVAQAVVDESVVSAEEKWNVRLVKKPTLKFIRFSHSKYRYEARLS